MKSVTTYVLPSKPEFYVSSHAITSIAVSRSIRHGNEYGSTLAERRSCSQPPRLLLASKKGPTRSVISEHALDGHDYHSSPPSPLPLAKRKKEGLTAQLSRFDGSVKTIDPSESQDSLRLLDDATKSSEHRVSGAHQSKPSCSKGLLSPINFGSQLEKDEVDPTVTTSSQVPNGSKYQYYPPTNPSNGRGGFAQSYDTGPRRQLSYSDLKPRSLHKSTGSTELRREAEWSPERSDSSSWLDDSPNAFATRLWDSEPSRPKPRLRLDLTEDGGQIKEAHSTTVTTSPSKPQVVDIPRRRTTTSPPQPTSPITIERKNSAVYPQTPPQSSIGLGIDSVGGPEHHKESQVFDRIKARTTWFSTPTTPPSTPCSTPIVRRTPYVSASLRRPSTPQPPIATMPQLSELTTWMLTELERSIASPSNIQLDNLVIQQIRLPVFQRKVPRTPPSVPLSRYSTYKVPLPDPLSNYPPGPPSTSASSNYDLVQQTLPQFVFPISTTDHTLQALQSIFPHTSLSHLSSLQATILALHYVRSIHLPSFHSSAPFCGSPIPISPGTDISYIPSNIPSKARIMLGLPGLISRLALPTSWLRPQIMSWGESIEKLKMELGMEVGKLVRGCMGGCVKMEVGMEEGMEEVLVRAVGQIVRMGEVKK